MRKWLRLVCGAAFALLIILSTAVPALANFNACVAGGGGVVSQHIAGGTWMHQCVGGVLDGEIW